MIGTHKYYIGLKMEKKLFKKLERETLQDNKNISVTIKKLIEDGFKYREQKK